MTEIVIPSYEDAEYLEKEERLLQFFSYRHLPERLQFVSEPFYILAYHVVKIVPRNQERTVALRKLLDAKDCAVRAMLFKS